MPMPQITGYRLQMLISRLIGAIKDEPGEGDVLRWNDARGAFEPQALVISGDGSVVGPQGPPGPQGPKGDKGDTGAAGAQGAAGAAGAAGQAGPQGPAGPPGADGQPGAAGPQGAAGSPGLAGAQGPQGPAGPPGQDGAPGAAGADGAPGAAGPAGPQGPAGEAGPAGPQGGPGPRGFTGADGAQGPQGLPGADGAPGATGPQGPQGPAGATGPAGADGATGAKGDKGDTGATGPQGPQGLQGLQGATGAQGPAGADGAQGPQGIQGATGPAGPSVWGGITGTLSSQADLSSALAGKAAAVHTHAQSDVTGLAAALALLAPLASPAFTGTPTGISKAHVGLANVDNTSDANKPISSAVATVLSALLGIYRTVLQASGSHTAARAAGTYAFGLGDPLAVSGTGTLYPLAVLRIDSADFPTVNGLAPKLRVKWALATNDVAPGSNFTFGLYPVTRPATSGGAGLATFTLGTVVTGSTSAATAPAADAHVSGASADFALPADGFYVIGVVTSGAIATSAHVHLSAQVQARNA